MGIYVSSSIRCRRSAIKYSHDLRKGAGGGVDAAPPPRRYSRFTVSDAYMRYPYRYNDHPLRVIQCKTVDIKVEEMVLLVGRSFLKD